MNKKTVTSDFLFVRQSAVSGMARILDFGGTFDAYNDSETPDEADANAMLADWWAVGDSLRSSICSFDEELRSKEKAA
jgi:hypothetical protein